VSSAPTAPTSSSTRSSSASADPRRDDHRASPCRADEAGMNRFDSLLQDLGAYVVPCPLDARDARARPEVVARRLAADEARHGRGETD
jgi:hypothetical protein